MTYKDAIAKMVNAQAPGTMYKDGASDWDADNLLSIEDDPDDTREYCYSLGITGSRPGVYILRDGYIESVPIMEPMQID